MKIILERKRCIGCGSCESICPNFFKLAEDGKSNLKGDDVKSKEGIEELQVTELDCAQQAADACPVQCIYIKK